MHWHIRSLYRSFIRYTAISRKVVGKNVQATIPKGIMEYDQYTVPDDCSCRTYFCCFPLALATHFQGLMCQFFQISLKKRELKTTHNAFQDCRVHFSRHATFLEIAVYYFSFLHANFYRLWKAKVTLENFDKGIIVFDEFTRSRNSKYYNTDKTANWSSRQTDEKEVYKILKTKIVF